MFSSLFSQLVNNVISNQRETLRQAVEQLDMDITAFQTLALQVNRDDLLSPYQLNRSGSSQIQATSRLALYRGLLNNVTEIGLYLTEYDTLYTSNGQTSLETYFEYSHILAEDWNAQQIREMLQSCRSFMMLPDEMQMCGRVNGLRYMVWVIPYPLQASQPIGAMIATINRDYFTDLLKGADGGLEIALCLADHSEIFVSHENEFTVEESLLQEALETNQTSFPGHEGTIDIIRVGLGQTGWSLLALIPEKQFVQRMLQNESRLILVTFLLALAAMALGVFMAWQNYSPVARLSNYITGQAKDSGFFNARELGHIAQAFDVAKSTNQQLKEQMGQEKDILRRQLIYSLLQGNYGLPEMEYLKMLCENGIDLSERRLFVLLIQPDIFSVDVREHITHILQREPDSHNYICFIYESKRIALLAATDNSSTTEMKAYAKKLVDETFNQTQRTLNIGISQPFEACTKANQALIEATGALEMARSQADEAVVVYKAGKTGGIIEREEITRRQMRLYHALAYGNEETFRDALLDMVELFSVAEQNTMMKYIWGETVCQVLRQIDEAKLEDGKKIQETLLACDTPEAFLVELSNVTDALRGQRIQESEKQKNAINERILQYINEHIYEANFSLSGLSEQFQMSTTKMSRSFKSIAGETFQNYVSDRRMQESCRLLVETNLKISEIMERVGYVDATSFSRKFIRSFGVSASQFRALHRDLLADHTEE